MTKILLVEDNSSLTFFIKQYFSAKGYFVETVDSGEKAIKIFNQGFSVILLDVGLPKMSGYAVLNYIRELNQEIPIIMITDKTSEYSEIESYDRGATFFHKKPINYKILASQIKKVAAVSSVEKQNYGQISISKDSKTLAVNDQDIKLTEKELKFALLLLKNQARTFSKTELFSEIYEDNNFSRSRIDTFLSRFKTKIGIEFFENSYGLGVKYNRNLN